MLRRLLVGVAVAVGAIGVLGAAGMVLLSLSVLIPAPSPKSTVPGPSGTPVVLDWKDYPASEGMDAEALLDAPDRAQLEAPARALMGRIASAVEQATDSAVRPVQPEAAWFGKDDWFDEGGNGYGGRSMLVSVNCCEVRTTQVPDRTRWRTIVDAVGDVTADAGMGRIAADYDARGRSTDPELSEEYRKQYCNLPGGGCWVWTGWVHDGNQWLDLTIQDGGLDPTGAAQRDAEAAEQPVSFVSVSYGATVVQTGRKPAYERALAPFRGLTQPPATDSD